jgi:hypothetical protein
VLSRAESLYDEEEQMKTLSRKLADIPKTDDPALLNEAKSLIIRLQGINRRWNIDGLDRFLKERQRELFF